MKDHTVYINDTLIKERDDLKEALLKCKRAYQETCVRNRALVKQCAELQESVDNATLDVVSMLNFLRTLDTLDHYPHDMDNAGTIASGDGHYVVADDIRNLLSKF